jgi:hypothetical protein
MSIGAVITGLIMALVFIIGLTWCFRKWQGGGSEWED